MEPTFASRVLAFRKHKGLSQQAFADQCGLDQGNITQMERGTDPKTGNAIKIITGFPDLNPDWLLLNQGSMLREGKELTRLPADPKPETPTAGPLSVVPESEQVKELKAQNEELRKQLEFMRDLMRSGVDFSKLQPTGSFSLGDALAVVETGPPSMRIAA